jgi:hypothetical protein
MRRRLPLPIFLATISPCVAILITIYLSGSWLVVQSSKIRFHQFIGLIAQIRHHASFAEVEHRDIARIAVSGETICTCRCSRINALAGFPILLITLDPLGLRTYQSIFANASGSGRVNQSISAGVDP